MAKYTRYLKKDLLSDLKNQMVFIGGPRQVGKTTLSLSLLSQKNADESHPGYLNWDVLEDRENLLHGNLPEKQRILILDEIHKFKQWRNLVKGFYDKNKSRISFVVTGSAKLDYYRKGGDSLQGRYHYYRLHPFSLMEIDSNPNNDQLQQLLRFGGFPDPLLTGKDRFHRRWLRECSARIIHEDLRDLELVREISMIDLLLTHLPSCVGSPLSINSLSKLIQVAHQTLESWICIMERLYVCFRIPPFGSKKIRAVKKEKKMYFWDWSRVPDSGSRFENMVACQLNKYCHYIEDTEGFDMELRYIRDTDKREVDFVVLKDGRPEFAVECKVGEKTASPACKYFRERTDIPRFYQVHCGSKDTGSAETGTRVLPFLEFCKKLKMP
ncbi:ATP-binding protein [Verrucomicrobiota bacterium]